MTVLHLSKLHATGNDFIVWNALAGGVGLPDAATVSALCDRHRGIGADGFITLGPGPDATDCSMTLQNADGGAAEMSGNGVRCLARVAAGSGVGTRDSLVVDTAAGRRAVSLVRDVSGDVVAAEVDMGSVTFDPSLIPLDAPSPFDLEFEAGGTAYRGDAAGMGNPHVVLFVADPSGVPVEQHGPLIERDPRLPKRANVEFIAVAGDAEVVMRVWERGVGETLSCGTGACAAAAVATAAA
ncbi:MAG: diaminopimelate epimerase [Acidimicrobiia bacterium]|nr:diaminopimelate epimerase [Acidimicrobiia bacterium]